MENWALDWHLIQAALVVVSFEFLVLGVGVLFARAFQSAEAPAANSTSLVASPSALKSIPLAPLAAMTPIAVPIISLSQQAVLLAPVAGAFGEGVPATGREPLDRPKREPSYVSPEGRFLALGTSNHAEDITKLEKRVPGPLPERTENQAARHSAPVADRRRRRTPRRPGPVGMPGLPPEHASCLRPAGDESHPIFGQKTTVYTMDHRAAIANA